MQPARADVIRRPLVISPVEGPDKVTTLADSVRADELKLVRLFDPRRYFLG